MNNYRGFTFKRIFGIFWAIIYVVIVLLYVVTQTIVMKQATNNIEKNIKLSVTSSETSIEKSLEMTDLYLYENYYLSSPGSLSNLCYTYLYDENEVERVSALETISHIVSSIPSWNNNVSFAMLYS